MTAPNANGRASQPDLDELLAGLSGAQREYLLTKLLPPFLAAVTGDRSVYDEQGRLIGHFIPARQLTPEELAGADCTAAERERLRHVTRGPARRAIHDLAARLGLSAPATPPAD